MSSDLYLNNCIGLNEIMDSENLDPKCCQIKDYLLNYKVHEKLSINYLKKFA